MIKKPHDHNVTINDIRRKNKRTSDLRKKGVSKQALHQVFDTYYRDQVRALYKAISGAE